MDDASGLEAPGLSFKGTHVADTMSHDNPLNLPQAKPAEGASQQSSPLPQAQSAQDQRAAERLQRRVRIINQMKRIRRKYIVASGKGGVGKSTVAVNLACSLAAAGQKVGILDLDLTGPNVPKLLGIEGGELVEKDGELQPVKVSDNLSCVSMQFLLPDPDSPIIWRGPIKMGIIGQFLGDVAWGDLDALVVDLPPGTGDEPLSVAQNIPDADGVILVTTPQDVAVGDVRKSLRFVEKLQLPVLGVVENMSGLTVRGSGPAGARLTLDAGDGPVEVTAADDGTFSLVLAPFKQGGGRAMAEALGATFLGAVPLDPRIMTSGDEGRPIVEVDGSAAGDAFKAITERLLGGDPDA